MKIYVVNIVETSYNELQLDFEPQHHATSIEEVIKFLERVLEDSNSGISKDSIIQIDSYTLDSYYEGYKYIVKDTAINVLNFLKWTYK